MADTPIPAMRRQVLIAQVRIERTGQYVPIEVRLPASATRITGLTAVAAPIPGQYFERRDAFVIFAPEPTQPNYVYNATVTPVPGSVDLKGTAANVGQVLHYGYDMADGIAGYDPQRHVGFYQPLTDELPLQRLVVPAGKQLYYGQTVVLGKPKLFNALGAELELVYETYPGTNGNPEGTTASMFTRFVGQLGQASYGAIHSTLAYVCRVLPPPPRPGGYVAGQVDEGYYDGVLFPGDPDRF